MTTKYKIREFVCIGCNKSIIESRRSNNTTYCSLQCYRSSPRPERKNGVDIECTNCKKSFYIRPSQNRTNNFCSTECHNSFQSRNKTSHKCKICLKEFKWSPSRVIKQNPTFCSIDCRDKCSDYHRRSRIAGNLSQQNSKKRTSLEVSGAEILKSLGIEFTEQVLIKDKFVVDVSINDTNIIIQWDGDYWHGYRSPDDKRGFGSRELKRMALDKSQDAYMKKCGYNVIRFWEHEVKKSPEVVSDNIKRAIQTIAN